MTYDSKPDTIEHIKTVQGFMQKVINDLRRRYIEHDKSRFEEPEHSDYIDMTIELLRTEHGGEAGRIMRDSAHCTHLHMQRNDHHPEYYPNGIQDMHLLAILEMLCDWRSNKTPGEWFPPEWIDADAFQMHCKQRQYGFNDELAGIFKRTMPFLGGVFHNRHKGTTRESVLSHLNFHVLIVQNYLMHLVHQFTRRARFHDQSKLASPEVELFDKYTPLLKETTYGSDQYKQFLVELKPALDHHYAVNDHHPEHFANGIQDMNLLQIVEMLVDWLAATKRHNDGDIRKSIEINQKRFGYSDELKQIFLNTLPLLESAPAE